MIKENYELRCFCFVVSLFVMMFSNSLATVTVTADFDFEDNQIPAEFGTAAFGSGPTATNGQLVFDGTTAIQATGTDIFGGSNPTDSYGYEVIVTPSWFDAFDILASYVPGSGVNSGGNFLFIQNGGYKAILPGVQSIGGTVGAVVGQPAHIAVVINGGVTQLYINGVLDASGNAPAAADTVLLGGNVFDGVAGAYNGSIDRFRAFTFNAGEFNVGDLLFEFTQAHSPAPTDSAGGISVNGTLLGWTAGDTAISHDVYFGTDQTAVANADNGSDEFQGNQSGTSYEPGLLDFETTYFWRVDEVESTVPLVVHIGDVWSFDTRPPLDISNLNPDFNGDCSVDILDLRVLATEWLTAGIQANLIGSIDGGSDLVAFDDFGVLANKFGVNCITFEDLLQEMIDRDRLARFPEVEYTSLQDSSYDRASVSPDQPGWFANGDCCGYIRTEQIDGNTEYVIMEHDGPGVITRMWTPFFYNSFSNHVGPNVRIYLDGSDTPVIDENFIELLTRGDYPGAPSPVNSFTVPEPFANFTARAGTLFLPIPFGQSCKITTTSSPFYNIINYRGYALGTAVKSFTMADYNAAASTMNSVGSTLQTAPDFAGGTELHLNQSIAGGAEATLTLPAGSAAVRHLSIILDPHVDASTLRSTILQMTFDGVQTVWCPVGDFFCSPDSVHPFMTYNRTVTAGGEMSCRWLMPYQSSGEIKLLNLGQSSVTADMVVRTDSWAWDDSSMHFYTNWRRDNVPNPGNNHHDWNFIDVTGQGVHIGDSWTVVYPGTAWWGEGDEKIWVDDDFAANFPSQFGTGTEDYYGWAGGEPPHGDTDEFSNPFHSNVKVGELTNPRGYNISLRSRLLDATPFKSRFKLDIEAWNMENSATSLLAYSSGVTHWYGIPGATHNRPASPAEAQAPIYTADLLSAKEAELKGTPFVIPGATEFETLAISSKTGDLTANPENVPVVFSQSQWSSQAQRLMEATQVGDFVEFTIGSQVSPENITLYLAEMSNYGIVRVSVNGVVVDDYDTYSAIPFIMAPIDLGEHTPVGNSFVLRFEVIGKNAASSGYFFGLDAVVIGENVPQTYENVANGKPVSQSSTYQSYSPELAVNGNAGDFTHTDGSTDNNPWWEVDLGQEEPLARIKLFNRDSCCSLRLRDITVEIRDGSNTLAYTSEVLNSNGEMGIGNFDLTLDLPGTIDGRYLRIIRAGLGDPSAPSTMTDDNNVLALGEVEAYVVSNL